MGPCLPIGLITGLKSILSVTQFERSRTDRQSRSTKQQDDHHSKLKVNCNRHKHTHITFLTLNYHSTFIIEKRRQQKQQQQRRQRNRHQNNKKELFNIKTTLNNQSWSSNIIKRYVNNKKIYCSNRTPQQILL